MYMLQKMFAPILLLCFLSTPAQGFFGACTSIGWGKSKFTNLDLNPQAWCFWFLGLYACGDPESRTFTYSCRADEEVYVSRLLAYNGLFSMEVLAIDDMEDTVAVPEYSNTVPKTRKVGMSKHIPSTCYGVRNRKPKSRNLQVTVNCEKPAGKKCEVMYYADIECRGPNGDRKWVKPTKTPTLSPTRKPTSSPTSQPTPEPTTIVAAAPRLPVVAASQYPDALPASACIDGKTTTNCGSTEQTASIQDPWLQLDLGETKSISAIKIITSIGYEDRLGEHTLMLADVEDNSEWRTCFDGVADAIPEVTEPCVGEGRYVRISLPGSSRTISLSQVQVLSTGPEGYEVLSSADGQCSSDPMSWIQCKAVASFFGQSVEGGPQGEDVPMGCYVRSSVEADDYYYNVEGTEGPLPSDSDARRICRDEGPQPQNQTWRAVGTVAPTGMPATEAPEVFEGCPVIQEIFAQCKARDQAGECDPSTLEYSETIAACNAWLNVPACKVAVARDAPEMAEQAPTVCAITAERVVAALPGDMNGEDGELDDEEEAWEGEKCPEYQKVVLRCVDDISCVSEADFSALCNEYSNLPACTESMTLHPIVQSNFHAFCDECRQLTSCGECAGTESCMWANGQCLIPAFSCPLGDDGCAYTPDQCDAVETGPKVSGVSTSRTGLVPLFLSPVLAFVAW